MNQTSQKLINNINRFILYFSILSFFLFLSHQTASAITPTPSGSPEPSPSSTPTSSPSPSATPTQTPTPTPSTSPTASPSPTQSPTPTATPSPTPCQIPDLPQHSDIYNQLNSNFDVSESINHTNCSNVLSIDISAEKIDYTATEPPFCDYDPPITPVTVTENRQITENWQVDYFLNAWVKTSSYGYINIKREGTNWVENIPKTYNNGNITDNFADFNINLNIPQDYHCNGSRNNYKYGNPYDNSNLNGTINSGRKFNFVNPLNNSNGFSYMTHIETFDNGLLTTETSTEHKETYELNNKWKYIEWNESTRNNDLTGLLSTSSDYISQRFNKMLTNDDLWFLKIKYSERKDGYRGSNEFIEEISTNQIIYKEDVITSAITIQADTVTEDVQVYNIDKTIPLGGSTDVYYRLAEFDKGKPERLTARTYDLSPFGEHRIFFKWLVNSENQTVLDSVDYDSVISNECTVIAPWIPDWKNKETTTSIYGTGEYFTTQGCFDTQN